jgi:predicted metal-dependent phosphoesterase TrpH
MMNASSTWADLHVHTVYSDGLLTPSEMIQRAKAHGLLALGIADHDTIDGLDEAGPEAEGLGIEIVPAVELSSQFNGKDVHIIGYYFDAECPKLAEYLHLFRHERHKRAQRMIVNLNGAGVRIDISEVEEKAKGHCIGRPHLAEVLMEKGYCETIQEAFQRYIGYGSEAYEEKYKIQPEEAIRLITEAKGLAFLAHPGSHLSEAMILDFIKAGLDGIEVVHPFLSTERRRSLRSIADRYGLLVSGGSDCHGGRDGVVTMGKHKVPYAYLQRIREVHRSRWDGAPMERKSGIPRRTC